MEHVCGKGGSRAWPTVGAQYESAAGWVGVQVSCISDLIAFEGGMVVFACLVIFKRANCLFK